MLNSISLFNQIKSDRLSYIKRWENCWQTLLFLYVIDSQEYLRLNLEFMNECNLEVGLVWCDPFKPLNERCSVVRTKACNDIETVTKVQHYD